MEKFSRWRDPATGIQPFLPPQPAAGSPLVSFALLPTRVVTGAVRAVLLAVVALAHLLLVEGVSLVFTPIPALHRLVTSAFTALTCRLALGVMGYIWIDADMTNVKRGTTGVSQSVRSPARGDLIVCNWTSYVDALYLAFRYNPTFLLPIFSPAAPAEKSLTGRHTGTGSAQISTALPQPAFLGYRKYTLLALLARTGCLPETHSTLPQGMYKTLREARRKERGQICVFPEGTTSNGRAVLRVAEGVLGDGDVGKEDEGIVWVKYFKHPAPTTGSPTATCSIPNPLNHLLLTLLPTPTPFHTRSLSVRTLHPANAPSSPSFLPSEILASAPGGLEGAARDGTGVWREAVAAVLAETGRVRRVKGMGWVEKRGFLEYWNTVRR